MTQDTRKLLAIALVAAMIGPAAPASAGTIVYGTVFEQFSGADYGNAFDTGPVAGSATSDSTNWSYTCDACSEGISGNGDAKIIDGAFGVRSSVTVTGTIDSDFYASGDSGASYDESLTITGGTGSGILQLQYSMDGQISQSGTGTNLASSADVLIWSVFDYTTPQNSAPFPGVSSQIDNGPINASFGAGVGGGDGAYNKTLTFYIPFTYGTAFSFTIEMQTFAELSGYADTPPFTSTSDFYNTLTLDSAFVFDSTDPSNLGPANKTAMIDSTTGLTYGPNGIASASVPEPSTFALFCAGLLGFIGFRRRRSRKS